MEVDPAIGGRVDAAELYDRLGKPLFAYALSLTGDPARSEDLVHDAFLRWMRHDRPIRSAGGFLFTAVRNLAIDARRRAAIRRDAPLPLTPASPSSTPSDAAAAAAALSRLPEEQREAVVLKIYSGLTFAAIAEITGTTTSTAASRYRLAMEKLAELLSSEKPS